MSKRITQRDVARAAGVSHVTVSLALNGNPAIPRATTERIQKIARELGYSPDPMLSALSSYRKSQRPHAYQANIAWINNFKVPGELYRYDFGEYYRGAAERCRQLGYILEEYQIAEKGEDWKRLKRLLTNKGTKGILLAPSENAGARFELDLAQFSAVRFGYSYSFPELNTAVNAQFNTVFLAMRHLVSLGYERIGFILDEKVEKRTGWNFFGGFSAAQQMLQKKNRIAPLHLSETRGIPETIATWTRKTSPDCIISLHGDWRFQQLRKAGLDIPGEIGYADISLSAAEKQLSGVCQDPRQVGVMAVDLLVSMIHRQETGIPAHCTHVMADGFWIDGKTAPPRV